MIEKQRETNYLLLSEKVTDLNTLGCTSDTGINGKMSIHHPHFVAVSLGDTGDEVLDVAKRRPDSRRGLPGTEPRIDLQLQLSGGFVGDKLEVEVEMLEVLGKLSAGSLDLDDLCIDLDGHPLGDIHGVGGEDGLHLL